MDESRTRPEEAMANAGLIFICTVWLQGQMSDLVILKKNPELIPAFVANPKRVPVEFSRLRTSFWERQFGDVKNAFCSAFADTISDSEIRDIEHIYHVRNMIAHAHISVGRDYMLYRPAGIRKEREVIASLTPRPVDDQSDPLILKLSFWRPDVFDALSAMIERIDQVCFSRLAASIGVPHGRIR